MEIYISWKELTVFNDLHTKNYFGNFGLDLLSDFSWTAVGLGKKIQNKITKKMMISGGKKLFAGTAFILKLFVGE